MIKKFYSCIREYKRESLLAPFFITLEVIIDVIIPIMMARLIDLGIDKRDSSYILKMGFMLIIAAIMSLTCGVLSGKFAAIASTGFAKNLRHDIYHNVQDFSFSSIDKFSTASIVTRLTTDITNVQNSYQMIVRIAVRSPAMLIFAFLMAFNINKKLSTTFLITAPILALGIFLIIRNAYPIFQKVFKTYDKLNSLVQENLRGIRVVKSYVREDFENEKFRAVSGSIYEDFTKAEKILAFNMPLMQLAIYCTILLISWFGAKFIVNSTLTTGELMSFITYAMQILMNLMMLSMVLVTITISKASAERIYEVLEEKSDLINCNNPVYSVPNGDVVFENVSFSYSGRKDKSCLKNVNINIKSGETVGIIGGTGSSKTSMVQLIPRLYDTTTGSVMVGGIDVKDYDIETLRNSVAMVLQKNILFSGTIKDNLRWGNRDASDEELIRVCKLAMADDFIKKFPKGYDTYIEQGGTNVSGGQKQRICIARALLKKPKILILDDSTSAVDTKTDAHIRKALSSELPTTTKLIIAQRISSIEHADKIIVMDNGRISDVGTHNELLLNSSIYKEVYTSQNRGGQALGEH